ncbi:MAG: hypothetical protein WC781_02275 [Candidatus Pacearchaeota archaeon]|jgi:undecaprenyl pyrophosphate synthase
MEEHVDLDHFHEFMNHIEFLDYIMKKEHNYSGIETIINDYKAIETTLNKAKEIIDDAKEDEEQVRRWAENRMFGSKGMKALERWEKKYEKVKRLQNECFILSKHLYSELTQKIIFSFYSDEYKRDKEQMDIIYNKFIKSLEENTVFDPVPA